MSAPRIGAGDGCLRRALRHTRDASPKTSYVFRLCCVNLVLAGLRPREVGESLAVSERSVHRWLAVHRTAGAAGLASGLRRGRPSHLRPAEAELLMGALRQSPAAVGLNAEVWSGRLLQDYLKRQFRLELGVRQCQRLLARARDGAAIQQLLGRQE